ncbi:uncharacterized protein LOC102710145 [Oryza brachyantha]|uniref:uncharacterized protein LOC102710145 n=1 Tax=Oryza brachyantha TaxID=4533 RepID=UPI001ADC0C0B|nr:uncharacterized protein LOC102710145 [Oryza brachyantha]
MLCSAAQPRRSGWAEGGDARPAALPARSPPPPPPPPPRRLPAAAGRRGEGSGGVRGRGEEGTGYGGAEREGAVVAVRTAEAAGRNAVGVSSGLVTHGAERDARPVEERGNSGGELGKKRVLEQAARSPPPKWRAVFAKRNFPPGCGRDTAVPLGRGRDHGRDGGVRPLGRTTAIPLAGSEDGLLLDAAPATAVLDVVEKVASADGASSMVNVEHGDVVDAVLMKSSHGSDENQMACKIGSLENGAEGAASGKGADSGELLGRKEVLVQAAHLLPMWRMVPARRRFPPGCGRDVVAPLTGGEEGKAVTMVSGDNSVNQCAPNTVGALNVGVLGETVQRQELEEGEVVDEACEVQESQEVAGCVGLDESAGGRQKSVVHLTSDEVTRIMPLQEGCNDAALATENDLSMGQKCERILLDASSKCSFDGPQNEIVQGKIVLQSNGMKGNIPSLSMEDPGSIAQIEQELDEEMTTRECHAAQECQVATGLITHEPATSRHKGTIPANSAPELFIRHSSNVERCGNTSQHERRIYASVAAEDVVVVTNKCKGTSSKAAGEPWAEGPSKELVECKRERENDSMRRSFMNVATAVSGDVTIKGKTMLTARKTVKPPIREMHKPPQDTMHRPFSKGKEESHATDSASFGPRKRLKVKCTAQSKHIPVKIASTSGLVSKENLMHEKALNLENDDILRALSVHDDGNLELYINFPSIVQWHRQYGNQIADDRGKIRMLCRRFQFICRCLVQAVEQGSLKVRRVDLEADKIIRKLPGFTKPGPTVGNVRGVEVGDEFLYRVELAMVGLHRPYQGGIDTTDHNGVLVAISIVASGGYPDELSSSGELIYTGSGGKPAGKKKDEDQKLERGNLALKNCIKTKTPVRVIHGFKGQNREDDSHSKARQISTFTYDGLYLVVDCWKEGLKGSRVFKYRLQRIPGQPKLPLHIAKGLRTSVSRPGLCIADMSRGKEMVPICVINDVDNVYPATFQYISKIKYPSCLTKRRPQHHGCDCTDGCIDSAKCSCAVKNGGKIPFNFNGAIVHDKPLIFECGPSCKCHSSCHNRVSQKGLKIPLEVFRTASTGWGVRSLRSISSGSFVCEYVGIVLTGKEGDKRTNIEYLFDISHNYDDEDHSKGRPSTISGQNSFGACCQTMEDVGFTIDASEYGNIGRFINHSCSPNLYAQNVLWDHDDQRLPHIMFFAVENIPPLQELTYDYNFKIGGVHDQNGRVKVKDCHCGSPQCRGRLY